MRSSVRTTGARVGATSTRVDGIGTRVRITRARVDGMGARVRTTPARSDGTGTRVRTTATRVNGTGARAAEYKGGTGRPACEDSLKTAREKSEAGRACYTG